MFWTIRFESYGEPAEALRLEETILPGPASQRVRVKVHACGLDPTDWALCRGLFAGSLPRGIGLEVDGTVDAVGEDVKDVEIGQLVFGPINIVNTKSEGASDYAIPQHWTPVPSALEALHAAALPMAVAIAYGSLDCLGVEAGKTVLINGAGTTLGFRSGSDLVIVRIARHRNRGCTFADRLRSLGAVMTAYGDGLLERVPVLLDNSPDLILDVASVSGALPALVQIAGDPKRVVTISDFGLPNNGCLFKS